MLRRMCSLAVTAGLAFSAMLGLGATPAGAAPGDISTVASGFNWPVDVVRNGNALYVLEQAPGDGPTAGAIQRVDLQTGAVTLVTDGLNMPMAMTFDNTKQWLYVADVTNHIWRVNPTTGARTIFAGNGNPCLVGQSCGDGQTRLNAAVGTYATGLVFTPNGDLIVAELEANRIRRIANASGVVTTIAGTGVLGDPSANIDNAVATSVALVAPARLAIDPADGSIVFTEMCEILDTVVLPLTDSDPATEPTSVCGGVVWRIRNSNQTLQRVAGIRGVAAGTVELPAIEAPGQTRVATAVPVPTPAALRFDAVTGDLYVSQMGNTFLAFELNLFGVENAWADMQPAIRKVDRSGNISTVAGGTFGTGGDGGPASAAQLGIIAGFTPDTSTHMYAIDLYNGLVRRIEGAKPNLTASLPTVMSVQVNRTSAIKVTVKNRGSGNAYGPVTATVTLGTGVRFANKSGVVGTGGGFTCTASSFQRAVCVRPARLAPNATANFNISVRPTGNKFGNVPITVRSSSDSDDLNPSSGVVSRQIRVTR